MAQTEAGIARPTTRQWRQLTRRVTTALLVMTGSGLLDGRAEEIGATERDAPASTKTRNVLDDGSGAWQSVEVPRVWERDASKSVAGTRGGIGWYRALVKPPDGWASATPGSLLADSLTFSVGRDSHDCQVFLNGELIGEHGSLQVAVPEEDLGSGRFKVPVGLLQPGRYNLISLRMRSAGVRRTHDPRPPVLAGYHDEMVLAGQWQYRAGDDAAWSRLATLPTEASQFSYREVRAATTVLDATRVPNGGTRTEPGEALASMTVGEGLAVDLVLHEPIVAQPLSLKFDARGRLWVVQYRQYPYPAGLRMISRDKFYRAVYDRVPEPPPRGAPGVDQVSIHEDSDGDGEFDRHRVFLDDLNLCTSIEFGPDGLWVLSPPYLLYYFDRDGDDVPDGEPVVHLAGFGLEDTHSIANSLCWGPDGWLYGAHGSTVASQVTVPIATSTRQPPIPTYLEGPGMWRYDPSSHRFEVFAEGGGNAFGIEIDSAGRHFSGHNGSDTRGFHYLPHAYIFKGTTGKYGPLSNPYTFGMLPAMKHDPVPRFTHCFVIYEEEGLPAIYQGRLFGVDPLHRHVVCAAIRPDGATFATEDLSIALAADDPTFRPVDIKTGPDGAIYIADFCEQFIAHGQHFQGQIDPGSGRIFRLRSGAAGRASPSIDDFSDPNVTSVIDHLTHRSKWYRRTAQRLIRQTDGHATRASLARSLRQFDGSDRDVELLWARNGLGRLDAATLVDAMHHSDPIVRIWGMRLACDHPPVPPEVASTIVERASVEPDAEVRSYCAAVAKHLVTEHCLAIVDALSEHDQDVKDSYIPLLIWWALESQIDNAAESVMALFVDDDQATSVWRRPIVVEHLVARMMRRLAMAGGRQNYERCATLFKTAPDAASREALLAGFEEAFRGRPVTQLPDSLVEQLASLQGGSITFQAKQGNLEALDQLRRDALNNEVDMQRRVEYAAILGELEDAASLATLLQLISAPQAELQLAAIGAMKNRTEPEIGQQLLPRRAQLAAEARHACDRLLVARADWCREMLLRVESGTISADAIAADVVRDMLLHHDASIDASVRRHWPEVTAMMAAGEASQRIAELQDHLAVGVGDPYRGWELFQASCAKCHRMFGNGGSVGPELTGYQRDDTPRMLLHIVNPSLEIREGFETYTVRTEDGRIISGFLFDQDQHVVVLRTADGQDVTVARENVELMERSPRSLMPERLLHDFQPQQLRDLFAYLRSGQPVRATQ